MDILKICAIGLISAIFALTVKQYKPEVAILISVSAAVIILFMVADYLVEAVTVITQLSERAGVDDALLSSILKIIGVGYLTEFSASVCEDAGNKSIGEKISFAGKVIILVVALPVLSAVIDIISEMLL
ncbi:MAG: stage III sporulation protein AD [Clostridiales bacterium]|jgi:stage III sporulation protein AD|nr:stage III sporulation protein AD [Clostridiales bacterium]